MLNPVLPFFAGYLAPAGVLLVLPVGLGRGWLPGLGLGLLLALAAGLYYRYRRRTATQLVLLARPGASAELVAERAGPLLGRLGHKTTRAAATTELVALGDAVLPVLRPVLERETDESLVRQLTRVCARLGTPASRQLLLELAQADNLSGRAAALRALNSLPAVAAETPLFQKLMEEEIGFAQHLLHALGKADAELASALRYELWRGLRRLLSLLQQLYSRPRLVAARRALLPAPHPPRPGALEPLEALLPRPLYRALPALLALGQPADDARLLDNLLGPLVLPEPILTTIVRRGPAAFTAWTVGVALRQWHPAPATVGLLFPHLHTTNPLVQESARTVLLRLPTQRPAAHDELLQQFPTLATYAAMTTPAANAGLSFLERVRLLQNTALFAQTPENVLGSIVPIMREVRFAPAAEIFVEGSRGTSLFIICAGEVGISRRGQHLATFGPGEFFGELSLLDAEPRSATAVALAPVCAYRIDQEDFFDVTEECPEVLRGIVRELCLRLRRQNERMTRPAAEVVEP